MSEPTLDPAPSHDELAPALRAHLDDALPTPAERRADLARLTARGAVASSRLRLAGAALAGAALFGALNIGRVLFEPALAENGDVALSITDRDDETTPPLRVTGSRAVYLRSLSASWSSHALPGGLGAQLVRTDTSRTTAADVFHDVVAAVPGLFIDVDVCVTKRNVDVYANAVPANALVDALLEKLQLEAEVHGGALTVRCRGAAPGPLLHIEAGRPWPPLDAVLDRTVSLTTGDGVPLDQALASVAASVGVRVDYRAAEKPLVALRVENVSLGTLLAVLRETSGVLVGVDPRTNNIVVVSR